MARRAVLIVADGLRPDGLLQAETPHIDGLVARGASTWLAETVTPSVTLPCFTSMFRAVLPSRHGIVGNSWTPQLPLVPSLIDLVHDAGLGTASFYSWEPLRDLSSPGALDVAFCRRLRGRLGEDMIQIAEAAASYMIEQAPELCFIYLDAPDIAGHAEGWLSAAYLQAVTAADQAVGLVLRALESTGRLDETICVFTADHGGHGHDHAQGSAEDLVVPWVICGPGVRSGYRITSAVHITDTAPTIAALLGLTPPAEWQGQVVRTALCP